MTHFIMKSHYGLAQALQMQVDPDKTNHIIYSLSNQIRPIASNLNDWIHRSESSMMKKEPRRGREQLVDSA